MQVFDGFGPGAVAAVDGKAALCPPQRLPVVVCLLLPDRYLPVGIQERHLAPLLDAGLPDGVHLGVMPAARLVVLVKCGGEGVPRPVQHGLQVLEYM